MFRTGSNLLWEIKNEMSFKEFYHLYVGLYGISGLWDIRYPARYPVSLAGYLARKIINSLEKIKTYQNIKEVYITILYYGQYI